MTTYAESTGWKNIPSRAVIACDGDGNGCVVWWVGWHFEMELSENGLSALSDLGLDDAPEGISIWEGKWVYSGGGGYHGDDFYGESKGEFRKPTDEEWIKIRDGQEPWNVDDWRLPGVDEEIREFVSLRTK